MSKNSEKYGTPFQATLDNADCSTARAVKVAITGAILNITDIIISSDTALNFWIEDTTAVALTGKMYVPANSVFSKTFNFPIAVIVSRGINIKSSASGNIGATITGYSI